ncbi:GNAT family N-acetyltransferase [Streptomyces sp. NPDC048370]|uniref:GNAT family N-acetyltransferase n=1 Tax=Streptomyces sp. NPDC048370 TaxID=3365540 RepID=UPI0037103C24
MIEADIIRTPRLTLHPLAVEHAEEMAGVLAEPSLYVFIGGEPPTVAALRARYERQTAGSSEPGVSWCNWVVREREEGRLVGTVQATLQATVHATLQAGVHATLQGDRSAEVAWVVGTPWQGRGFAREAVRELVDWLTTHARVDTVLAHVHPDHAASAAVAGSVGLTPTDVWQDGEVRWRLDVSPSRTRSGHSGRPVA